MMADVYYPFRWTPSTEFGESETVQKFNAVKERDIEEAIRIWAKDLQWLWKFCFARRWRHRDVRVALADLTTNSNLAVLPLLFDAIEQRGAYDVRELRAIERLRLLVPEHYAAVDAQWRATA
jgi:hypothetical protein